MKMDKATDSGKQAEGITEVPCSASLSLRLRSLIADKEMVIACANHDIAKAGEWRCDYSAWMHEIDTEMAPLWERLEQLTVKR